MLFYPGVWYNTKDFTDEVLQLELFEWMTSTTWGESLLTLLVSMVPVIELRGGVPFGTALGLAPPRTGGMHHRQYAPHPLYYRIYPPDLSLDAPQIPQAQRSGGQAGEEGPPEGAKGNEVQIHRPVALCGHPPARHGAWTGALIAALLDMPLRKSIPSIFLGVVTAGLIMTFVTGAWWRFSPPERLFSAPA